MNLTVYTLQKMKRKYKGNRDKNTMRVVIKISRVDGYNEALNDVAKLLRAKKSTEQKEKL